MEVKINESWKSQLQVEFDKPYFESLTDFIKHEYSQYECYPPGKEILNAFEQFPFEDVKVVIIVKDLYI